MNASPPLTRWVYAAACTGLIALGLSSRRFGVQWGQWVVAYAGNVLWASMVVLALAWLLPRLRVKHLGGLALALCFSLEFSQLIQTPWLQGIRRTAIGGVLLGSNFQVSDLVCCAVGVGLGLAVKQVLDASFHRPA